MESLYVINAVTTMPVLRPLIGLDKQEIIDLARKIGTYETSILLMRTAAPFSYQNPATRPHLEQVLAAEAQYDIEALVEEAIAKTERITVSNTVRIFSRSGTKAGFSGITAKRCIRWSFRGAGCPH